MPSAQNRFRNLVVGTAVVVGGLSLSGCATEQYVDEHIAAVNARIDQQATRIDEVDKIARDGVQRADAAAAAAQAAGAAAQSAGAAAQSAASDAARANEDIAQMKPTVAHLEQHHLHKTWRDVTGKKAPKRRSKRK